MMFLLVALCILAVAAMAGALVWTGPVGKTEGFVPPPFDQTAKAGVPDVPEQMGYSQLDASVFQASLCGSPVMQDGQVYVYLTNPETNVVWLKVRIMDEAGDMLGESGLIKPGEYVETVALNQEQDDTDRVQLKLMSYEPDTYRSAGAVSLYYIPH